MRTSENSLKAKFVSLVLQGFEAIGSLLRLLVATGVYQAVLRQSSKCGVGSIQIPPMQRRQNGAHFIGGVA
jgi:hypothetical protein